MKPLSDFLPRLLVYVPACSEPLAEQALLDAAIEFCERSSVIRYPADPIIVLENTVEYEIWAPSNDQTVARVLKVFLNGEPIEAIMAEVRTPVPEEPARPTGYSIIEDDCGLTLRFNVIPDETYTLNVELALRPTKTAKKVDSQLYTRWMDAIVAGALSRLYAVPGQPFSDAGAALYQASRASRMTNSARIEGTYSRLRGSMSVRYRPIM
jgi:hypothetical protein